MPSLYLIQVVDRIKMVDNTDVLTLKLHGVCLLWRPLVDSATFNTTWSQRTWNLRWHYSVGSNWQYWVSSYWNYNWNNINILCRTGYINHTGMIRSNSCWLIDMSIKTLQVWCLYVQLFKNRFYDTSNHKVINSLSVSLLGKVLTLQVPKYWILEAAVTWPVPSQPPIRGWLNHFSWRL